MGKWKINRGLYPSADFFTGLMETPEKISMIAVTVSQIIVCFTSIFFFLTEKS